MNEIVFPIGIMDDKGHVCMLLQEALRAKLDAARKRLKAGVRISDKLQVGLKLTMVPLNVVID